MKRVYGWAGVRYVITKFSRMDSLPNFLTRFARAGAPLLIGHVNLFNSIIMLKISNLHKATIPWTMSVDRLSKVILSLLNQNSTLHD